MSSTQELQIRAAKGAAKWSCKQQELQKEVVKRNGTKELQTVAKGIANSGCKKELETEIAERSCQTKSQKHNEEAPEDDEAGNAEINLFRGSSVGLFLAIALWGFAGSVVYNV